MPEPKKLHCNSCGYEWVGEILTKDERKKAELKPQGVIPIHCPKCNRTDIRVEK